MNIPQTFQKKIVNAFGEAGETWLTQLPERVNTYLDKWDLKNHGPVANLSYNYVLRVSNQAGTPCILKLGVPNKDFTNEIQTVQRYNGEGCARLLNAMADDGVMLLEQLQPGLMLDALDSEDEQMEQFTNIWKAIRRQIPPEVKQLTPKIEDWFQGIATYRNQHPEGSEIKIEHLQLAENYVEEIKRTTTGAELLHGDLHHENILYSKEKGWLAIDPKGVVGDVYYDTVSFFINKLDGKENPRTVLRYRVKRVSELLQLDEKRLLKAAIALSTLSACWAQEDSMPEWKETYQCTQWFIEFLED